MKPTLADVRHMRGWSQRELASRSGVQASHVGAIEARHTKAFPGWRRRISAALSYDEHDIAWGDFT
jgi:transcriptional regulator with XRE-family HTH domain